VVETDGREVEIVSLAKGKVAAKALLKEKKNTKIIPAKSQKKYLIFISIFN